MAGEIASDSCTPSSFDILFTQYAKFGDPKSKGEAITLSNSDKWMKAAGIIVSSLPVNRGKAKSTSDGDDSEITFTFTLTDTGIEFKKVAKTRKALDKKSYDDFLLALIRRKLSSNGDSSPSDEKVSQVVETLRQKMVSAGAPCASSSTVAGLSSTNSSTSSSSDVVARLTDHTKYTGSHKLRFDPETGKGRGKAGRV